MARPPAGTGWDTEEKEFQMGSLSSIVSRVVGGGRTATRGRRGTGMGAGVGRMGGRAGGRRPQDEAIGRGVRSLLRRAR